jgi:sterol desaturase/sphingolipid hydroxylase (fatty acid hydroxylase superfamily)
MRIDSMDASLFALFFMLGGLFTFWVMSDYVPPCPQLPIDNELIYVNDSTYHRIHVRIDTTLYYADKPQAIETPH